MVELTELDGVAEGRAENLQEEGYDSVEDLTDADPEVLAENVSYLPEDTALDLVVQAQNIAEEEKVDGVEESEPITEEVAEAVEEVDGEIAETVDDVEEDVADIAEDVEEAVEEVADDVESGEPDSVSEIEEEAEDLIVQTEDELADAADDVDAIEFTLSFDSKLQYDTFFDAVMGQRATMLRSNRSGVESFEHALDELREAAGPGATIELSMEEAQLNDLHNCIRQKTIEYKGNNLIDHMDELKSVLSEVNDVREEHLF